MSWIDPDGSSVLGPSSEWLWTAISTVAVLVSLAFIYRELRLQSGLKESQQLGEVWASWTSERMARNRLAYYLALQRGERVWDIRAAWRIAEFRETVGSLMRSGHVGRKQVVELFGPDVVLWWRQVEGFVGELRVARGAPSMNEHFEWLYRLVVSSGHEVGY